MMPLADIAGGYDPLRTWPLEPGPLTFLFATGALYCSGLGAMRRATGRATKQRVDAWWFGAAWVLTALALVSPLHGLSQVLFSAHMLQHELLMVAAAPLFALSRPSRVWLWALATPERKRATRVVQTLKHRIGRAWVDHPATAWAVHALSLWAWHVPRFFAATRGNESLHALQHACFLGSAVWFWHAVFFGPERRAGYGMAVVYLFTTALHTGALGALLTFAGTPWYPDAGSGSARFDLTALEDQQLGGLIMWVPGGLTYVIAALALVAAWMRESGKRADAYRAGLA